MVVTDDYSFDSEEMKCRPFVGSCLNVLPVIFNADNSKAYMASQSDIIVVNVSTGTWENVLSHKTSDEKDQTIAGFHFLAPNKLITITEAGLRTVWNADDGTVVSTRYVNMSGHKILKLHVNTELSETILYESDGILTLTAYENEKKKICLQTKPHGKVKREMTALTEDYLIVCEKRMVFAYSVHSAKLKRFEYVGKMKGVTEEKTFFVVAAACNDTVAAAMEIGRVFLWDNVKKDNMRSPSRTLHWHRCAPNMVLTPYGALVSGGEESALVKYSLNKTKTALTPSILPRLQANILAIGMSDDGAIVSVLLDDNSVHFVLLASMTVLSSVKAVHSRRNSLPESPIPLVPDPFHPDSVVISGYPGRLHWVNVNSGVTIETVDITGERAFSQGVERNLVGYSDIVSVAFSAHYGVVSTSRLNTEVSENLIKFWSRAPSTGYLCLQFECSYGITPVNILKITDDSDAVLSVDIEGRLSSWHRAGGNGNAWSQSSCVTFQDMAVSYASQFKKSLVALIHKSPEQSGTSESSKKAGTLTEELQRSEDSNTVEGVVVIWDVRSVGPPVIQQCCCLDTAFITAEWDPNPSSSLIFLSSASYVCAYNIHKQSVTWMITDLPGIPRIGMTSDYFYFFINSEVYLFKEFAEHLSKPLKFELPRGKHFNSVIGINRGSEFRIVLRTLEGLMLITRDPVNLQLQNSSEVKKSAFARINNKNVSEVPKTKLPYETKSAIEVFSGPTHALPPVSILARPFIEASLLLPKVA